MNAEVSQLSLPADAACRCSIIARGKSLHSAVSSLSNFDAALERFSAWMSETESQLEYIDGEVERLGARQDQQALRVPCNQLKVSPSAWKPPADDPFPIILSDVEISWVSV